ncbi:PaaX family transcriptional regulator [Kineococcus sp. SYSU DK002]|uniref:PaaX family transcriptional regulator n=1 Tax=Kineococcus sp. SYSU DK002 TaxID=3383123 RepID=UPI003D7F1514
MIPSPRTVVEAFCSAGRTPLAVVYDTANAAGLPDQPVRLAIRRLVAAGDVVQDGRGRAGTLTLTDAGRARLTRDRVAVDLALAQDAGHAPWDRTWRLIAVSVEETARAVRDTLRRNLIAVGAAPVSTGLYVSPHDLADLVGATDHRHFVLATATALRVHGHDDPHRIAEDLWPARPVDERYDALADLLDTPAHPDPLVQQLRLAEGLERALRDDPLIPPELRPRPWRPAELRRRWAAAWAALADELGERGLHRD